MVTSYPSHGAKFHQHEISILGSLITSMNILNIYEIGSICYRLILFYSLPLWIVLRKIWNDMRYRGSDPISLLIWYGIYWDCPMVRDILERSHGTVYSRHVLYNLLYPIAFAAAE